MPHADRRPGVRPRFSVGRRLDSVARASFPVTVTILLMLLIEVPLGIGGQAELLPAAALCCVWFWTLTREDHFPPLAVFLIGVLLDLLGYLPPGVGTLTLLCVHGVALALRRFLAPRGFAWAWCAFAPVAAGASLLIWLLVMLLTLRLLSPGPALFQAGVSFAIYPLLAGPMATGQRSNGDDR